MDHRLPVAADVPWNNPLCRECAFWMGYAESDTERAECRRHAPMPNSNEGERAIWPITRGADGCAEGSWEEE